MAEPEKVSDNFTGIGWRLFEGRRSRLPASGEVNNASLQEKISIRG